MVRVDRLHDQKSKTRDLYVYPRLIDVADEGLENMTPEKLEKPLTDRAPIVYSEFNLDVNKTEDIIRSLNRADLLGKVKVT